MKTIVAAVDFSAVTDRVAEAAIKLARPLRARIVFVHVIAPPAPIRDVLPAVEDVQLRTLSTTHAAEKHLAGLKRTLGSTYHPLEFLHVTGATVPSLIQQAQLLAADYLVIGSHGHSAMHDVLLGSVAAGVAKKSPCPVLVIPPVSGRPAERPAATRESVGHLG